MATYDLELDTSGLNCPLPVLKARKALASMDTGETLYLIATDEGALKDIPVFTKMTGHNLVDTQQQDGKLYFVIEKGKKQ